MNNLEAIEQRKSRRSYLDTPVDQIKLNQLHGLIDTYNSEAGLSISLVLDGSRAFNGLSKSYGMFKNVRSLVALKGKKEDSNLKEKLGHYGEMIVLEATKMGLGTCWVGGTFDRKCDIANVKENEELSCVITIGNIAQEQTFRERLVHNIIHRKTKPLDAMYTSDSPVPQWFLDGMKAVQRAPSAMNLQPVKFEYKNGEVSAFVEDNRFLTDLGIAKIHFSLATSGSFELGNHGRHHR